MKKEKRVIQAIIKGPGISSEIIRQLDAKVSEAWDKFTEMERYGTKHQREEAYGYYCGVRDISEFIKNQGGPKP